MTHHFPPDFDAPHLILVSLQLGLHGHCVDVLTDPLCFEILDACLELSDLDLAHCVALDDVSVLSDVFSLDCIPDQIQVSIHAAMDRGKPRVSHCSNVPMTSSMARVWLLMPLMPLKRISRRVAGGMMKEAALVSSLGMAGVLDWQVVCGERGTRSAEHREIGERQICWCRFWPNARRVESARDRKFEQPAKMLSLSVSFFRVHHLLRSSPLQPRTRAAKRSFKVSHNFLLPPKRASLPLSLMKLLHTDLYRCDLAVAKGRYANIAK